VFYREPLPRHASGSHEYVLTYTYSRHHEGRNIWGRKNWWGGPLFWENCVSLGGDNMTQGHSHTSVYTKGQCWEEKRGGEVVNKEGVKTLLITF